LGCYIPQKQASNVPLNGIPAVFNQKRFAHSVEEASFDIVPYKLHLLTEGPAEKTTLTRKDGLDHYRDLVSYIQIKKVFIFDSISLIRVI